MNFIQGYFLLSPAALGFFPSFLLQIVILAVLLTWNHKSPHIWFLIGWLTSLILMLGSLIIGLSLYIPIGGYIYWIGGISFAWFTSICTIQLAYRFPSKCFPKEARYTLIITLLLWIGLLLLMAYEALVLPNTIEYAFVTFFYGIFIHEKAGIWYSAKIFDIFYPIVFLWAPMVWLRQSITLSRQAIADGEQHPSRWQRWGQNVQLLATPQSMQANTARTMALVFTIAAFGPVISMLEEKIIVPVGSFSGFLLIATMLFVVLYLDRSHVPTTIQVKLIGISLVTIMVLLGLIGPFMLQQARQMYDTQRRNEVATIRVLLEHGITDQMPSHVSYIATRPIADGLFSTNYQMLYTSDPTITSQMLVEQDAPLQHMLATKASNIPFRWNKITHIHPWLHDRFDSEPPLPQILDQTIPDGVQAYHGRFSTDPHHHFLRYIIHLDETTLAEVGYSYYAYRQMIHTQAVPILQITIGTLLLFLLLIPLFIKASLVNPLNALQQGVRQVEEGNLDVAVPIRVADEIGFLTGAFNRMVVSLRDSQTALLQEIAVRQQKEHALTELTATLEQQVADRTRALTALYEVSSIAGQSFSLETMIQETLPRILTALETPTGLVYLPEELTDSSADGHNDGLHLVAYQGIPPDIRVAIQRLTKQEPIIQAILAQASPLHIDNVATDRRVSPVFQYLDYPTMLIVPLWASRRTYGVVVLFHTKPYTQEVTDLATSLAEHIGKAIETYTLFMQAQKLALLEDRQRLARDLHDSITQSLYGLSMLAEAGQAQLENERVLIAYHTFTRVGETARQCIREIRLFIHQLRPSVLEEEGLVGAIQLRLTAVEGRTDMQTHLIADESLLLNPQTEIALYHIAQEALNNTLRHAKATVVTVMLTAHEEQVILEVCDNGCGFLPTMPRVGGMGLANMDQRVQSLGGTFLVRSSPSTGTTIRVVLPATRGARA
jgi:signal transduction histidine kinase